MNLVEFTLSLPGHWATAPIYAHGVELPAKPGQTPRIAEGKSPLGRASHENLSPRFSAEWIKDHPEQFKAIGVYTGMRSGGLVIFDVDRNLGAIQEKWGADLKNAPQVKSKKKNAAKYLFIVPEADRASVAGLSHTASGQEGWEVLWGSQGVLFGAYKDEGRYTFKGDLNNIPDAPEWLLLRMREQYRTVNERKTSRGLKDQRYAKRSREEKIALAESCLSVIEPRGAFSERFWWEIGAMIHSELPGSDGLKLWEVWSKKDLDYADEWAAGKNPCAARWEAGFSGNGLGFGSLVRLADGVDPDRTRFQRDGLTQLVEEIQAQPVKYKQEILSTQEVIARAQELEDTIDNPAELYLAKSALAIDAGLSREGAAGIDRLLDTHDSFLKNRKNKPVAVSDLEFQPLEYIIPGLLPKPWLLLVHADGGTGKSVMCQQIVKHVSMGKPFEVYGALEKVKKGKVLWLNGDQGTRIVHQQFEALGVQENVFIVDNFDMTRYRWFKKLQGGGVDEDGNYTPGNFDLVIIDSLSGCNDTNPHDENKREFATPLRKLARNNGTDFGNCTIIVIHHNNKNGGFRGTSAIKACVDETWNMQKLENKQIAELGIPYNSRVVTIDKSRDDREGHHMLFSMLPDFTYKIGQLPKSPKELTINTPNQLMQDVLELMRRTEAPYSIKELIDDDQVGGVHRQRALRHVLKRLEALKLILRCEAPGNATTARGGRPRLYFQATGFYKQVPFTSRSKKSSLLRGDIVKSECNNLIPSGTKDFIDTPVCQNPSVVKTPGEDVPPAKSSQGFLHGEVLTNGRVNETPSSATDKEETPFFHANKGEDQPRPSDDNYGYPNIPKLDFDCPF